MDPERYKGHVIGMTTLPLIASYQIVITKDGQPIPNWIPPRIPMDDKPEVIESLIASRFQEAREFIDRL